MEPSFLITNRLLVFDCHSGFYSAAKNTGRSGKAVEDQGPRAGDVMALGIPIERVSILLGRQSVRVTERHYNPWVRSRQEQLEGDLERAWSPDPIVLLEAKVTRRLRGETRVLN